MFAYYFDLALHSLRRNRVLTVLMIAAIAVGIGASMTMVTVLHVLSGDPMPGKSQMLFYPQVDPTRGDYTPGDEPPATLTWIDGMNLLRARRADRQALMAGGAVSIQPTQSNAEPFFSNARYTTADFFPMFGTPFRYGRGWSAADDDARARVVVISNQLNNKLFGGKDSTGQTLRMSDKTFRIIGVLGDWRPSPRFYDLGNSGYSDSDDVYVPLSTSRDGPLAGGGGLSCWGSYDGDDAKLETAPCAWMQFWVQIDDPAKVAGYREFLTHYSQEQKALGRFEHAPNIRLRGVMEWLDFNHVVPADVRLQTGLAVGFLLVCLVNTVGLMLAKFLRRADELSIRRALGASRKAVFKQMLVESGVIGLTGGIGGLLLAFIGLWLVRQQPTDYAELARMDPIMLITTLVVAVVATLLAGLLPAWRACLTEPALQLKSQ